jgi:hypothetical protein
MLSRVRNPDGLGVHTHPSNENTRPACQKAAVNRASDNDSDRLLAVRYHCE